MIWLLLAAQVSAPTALRPDSWFAPGDVPDFNQKESGLIRVGYGITVTPAGAADTCRVEYSSGDLRTDRYICSVLLRNARFLPAKDGAGQPTYGVYRDMVSWWSGDRPDALALPPADVELTVERLPPRTKAPADVRVSFAVDPNGKPSSCAADSTGRRVEAELVAVGCQQLLAGFKPLPARTSAGAAIPSVQNATIRFVEAKS
jgi:hypothetical protein